jgi:hypothetical protein
LPTSGKDSMPDATGRGHGARLPRAAWWEQEVDTVLSSEEERIWDDVQRFWAEEADEPPLPEVAAPVPGSDVPSGVVVGVSSTILLLLFGAAVAALAIATATAVGWAVWRHWRWPAEDRWAD